MLKDTLWLQLIFFSRKDCVQWNSQYKEELEGFPSQGGKVIMATVSNSEQVTEEIAQAQFTNILLLRERHSRDRCPHALVKDVCQQCKGAAFEITSILGLTLDS